jgi:hypothetical protein
VDVLNTSLTFALRTSLTLLVGLRSGGERSEPVEFQKKTGLSHEEKLVIHR